MLLQPAVPPQAASAHERPAVRCSLFASFAASDTDVSSTAVAQLNGGETALTGTAQTGVTAPTNEAASSSGGETGASTGSSDPALPAEMLDSSSAANEAKLADACSAIAPATAGINIPIYFVDQHTRGSLWNPDFFMIDGWKVGELCEVQACGSGRELASALSSHSSVNWLCLARARTVQCRIDRPSSSEILQRRPASSVRGRLRVSRVVRSLRHGRVGGGPSCADAFDRGQQDHLPQQRRTAHESPG